MGQCFSSWTETKSVKHWAEWVDDNVDEDSRWHSSQTGLVRSADRLGDHVVWKLREAMHAAGDDMAIADLAWDVRRQRKIFDSETRLLAKLADTGRVVLLFERTVDSTLGILSLHNLPAKTEWHQQLQQERDERMMAYEALLADEERLVCEMGDEQQQLELLTLLRHSCEQYGEAVLTPRELDVMSAAYDAVVWRWNGVVACTPHWFATSNDRWAGSWERPVKEGEEACVRQAALWADLHHPNLLRFYGACHVYHRSELSDGEVYTPFVIERISLPTVDLANFDRTVFNYNMTWQTLRDWTYGLAYIHDRGLVYKSLSEEALRYCPGDDRGVLSGMGLVRRLEAGNNNTSQHNGDPSAAANMLTFGLIIFERLRAHRGSKHPARCWSKLWPRVASKLRAFCGSKGDYAQMAELPQQLPDTRPEFLKEAEWELLTSMCATDPTLRASTEEIVYKMEMLADEEAATAADEEASPALTTVDDLAAYVIQTADETIKEVLTDADDLLEGAEEATSDTHRIVYDRLVNIYEQLKAAPTPLSMSLVESYVTILWRFFLALERQTSGNYSIAQTICASRTVAGKNYSLHYAIDRLLANAPDLNSSDPVHHWQPAMHQARWHQRQVLQVCLEDPSELLDQLETEAEKAEAVALLQFEVHNNRSSVNTIQPQPQGQQGVLAETELPQWFIPEHQVELQTHIADGAFGAVYRGKWLGTDVVVKQVLADDSDSEMRKQFVQEANLWFKLNHENLILLYGACHEGRPFFVLERAADGTLVENLKKGNRLFLWRWLIHAAQGLRHLHENGIVHADLKGNNILIRDGDIVKLADFGLSVIANRVDASATGEGALGAFRWKAPECLLGAQPTFASDIYSFGMCILEA